MPFHTRIAVVVVWAASLVFVGAWVSAQGQVQPGPQLPTLPSGLGPQTTQAPETPWGLVTDEAVNDPDGVLRHAAKAVITIGTIRLTADDVDFDRATGRLDLRGNVQMFTRVR